MNITGMLKATEQFAVRNSPSILSAIGVVGTLSTAYLTGRATFRAVETIQAEQWLLDKASKSHPLENREKFELVWKLYLPAAGSTVATIVAIVMANQIGSRRAAAITAAYALSERAFTEYREKIQERIGSRKEQDIRDELAAERVKKNPPGQIVVVGSDVICFDEFSGRYFKGNVETIRRSQNEINYKITHEMYASLSDFYDKIGLEQTSMSDLVGWNADRLLELTFSTVLTEDERPALSIGYNIGPIYEHARCVIN